MIINQLPTIFLIHSPINIHIQNAIRHTTIKSSITKGFLKFKGLILEDGVIHGLVKYGFCFCILNTNRIMNVGIIKSGIT